MSEGRVPPQLLPVYQRADCGDCRFVFGFGSLIGHILAVGDRASFIDDKDRALKKSPLPQKDAVVDRELLVFVCGNRLVAGSLCGLPARLRIRQVHTDRQEFDALRQLFSQPIPGTRLYFADRSIERGDDAQDADGTGTITQRHRLQFVSGWILMFEREIGSEITGFIVRQLR
jgi:hypothetical protein